MKIIVCSRLEQSSLHNGITTIIWQLGHGLCDLLHHTIGHSVMHVNFNDYFGLFFIELCKKKKFNTLFQWNIFGVISTIELLLSTLVT